MFSSETESHYRLKRSSLCKPELVSNSGLSCLGLRVLGFQVCLTTASRDEFFGLVLISCFLVPVENIQSHWLSVNLKVCSELHSPRNWGPSSYALLPEVLIKIKGIALRSVLLEELKPLETSSAFPPTCEAFGNSNCLLPLKRVPEGREAWHTRCKQGWACLSRCFRVPSHIFSECGRMWVRGL